jgi:hypothetical protein
MHDEFPAVQVYVQFACGPLFAWRLNLSFVNIVFDEDGDQLITLWKTLYLFLRDGSHESCFPAVGGAEQAVELVLLQVQLGFAKKSDGTICKRENNSHESHLAGKGRGFSKA